MLKLEPRPQASRLWTYGSPLLALAVTVLIGIALFMALGKDPVRGLQVFFWEPIKSQYALGELMVKATPLLLIALGLAVCFRSNVWNIGAEGQFVIGAVVAGGVGANRQLRAALDAAALKRQFEVFYPPLSLCTDNGAMIAYAGAARLALATPAGAFSVRPRWPLASLEAVAR